MFQKVLVVDDHDDVNRGVSAMVTSMNAEEVVSAQYCDEAWLKLKKSNLEGDPFDLLITDLSFKKDHRDCKIASGEELIATIRTEHPALRIVVYSMKDQLQKVRSLIKKHTINAYVLKDRNGSVELRKAIEKVYNNELYVSPQVAGALSKPKSLEIKDYDIELLKQLSFGLSQQEISQYFKDQNVNPSSLSSVEKRLNALRIQFKANNAIHLVSIVKDLGLL
ncbi:response regulator [Jejudonia soesokkakensis]|uniref:Response regulator n=1 Tax=Jejudonia soesokkakensis TaxID=1323432 RepID=A0ABW2MSQ2_9FLAO